MVDQLGAPKDEDVLARLLFSLATSCATSPLMIVELFHSALSSVDEATYFGRLFIRSAYQPPPVIDGQAWAKPSYVFRPSSRASLPRSRSPACCRSSSERPPYLKLQPPSSKPSAPPGSSTTPSTVTKIEATTFLIGFPP